MPVPITEGTIYRFVNIQFAATLELDPRGQRTVLNDFTGTGYQQWEARRGIAGYWKFRNVATGLNLGFDVGRIAENGTLTIGTAAEFLWEVRQVNAEGRQCLHLLVPNTIYALEGSYPQRAEAAFPFNNVQVWEYWKGPNQTWFLDAKVDQGPPCVSGSIYKILSSNGSSVVHLEDDTGNVSGYRYNEGRNQLWEATAYENEKYMWSFKNVSNGHYLSISGTAKEGTRIIGSPTPFVWYIAPDSMITGAFRMFVPYTKMNVDLHMGNSSPGTVIHLYKRAAKKYWRFQKVGSSDDSHPKTSFALGPADPH
ncbi:hypothetical protein CC1G_10003 [Coprinopsis cinerea okayama7|uniref:Ricin B lectin domain-containing protein n=1 Tax=Coprinopsis cinerea (strain Okayama-7 / 130 / ATCC MYA-4618 / FGSC 9003) TaxID=240176 RepID=A8NDJ7_COPC7|nr:hypothetical protein CC1G_10003 [Coprinopsis cinerea okayama7\|eukprot:XP_001832789.1 hypothetical protein CC1G_10003 [Coprinopsis cinerea okayama7\